MSLANLVMEIRDPSLFVMSIHVLCTPFMWCENVIIIIIKTNIPGITLELPCYVIFRKENLLFGQRRHSFTCVGSMH